MAKADYPDWQQKRIELKSRPILALSSEISRYRGSENYGHIRIQFRYLDERDELSFYHNHDFDFIGKAYHDLWIDCQMDSDHSDELSRTYGWSFGYLKHSTSVELIEAEHMAKTLRGVENKLKRLRLSLGKPRDFAQYAAYIIQAVGCKRFAIADPYNYAKVGRYLEISEGLSWINSEIYRIRKHLLEQNSESGYKKTYELEAAS